MKDVLRNKNASVVLINLLEGEMTMPKLKKSAIKNDSHELAKKYEKYVEKYW